MTLEEKLAAVVAAHPLVGGRGQYEGQVVCTACHLVLGYPGQHLVDALLESKKLPEPALPPLDPRESQIDWSTK